MLQAREPLPDLNLKELADALLQRVDQLLPNWLPNGRYSHTGAEYVCGSLAGGEGDSCSVNYKTGKWSDFATGEGGRDLLDLYAAIHGLTVGKAAVQVAREEGLEDVAGVVHGRADVPAQPKAENPRPPPPPPAPAQRSPEWTTVVPVPEYAGAPTFTHFHRSAADLLHTAAYRCDGMLFGYVVRFATSDGGKETLPYTWCTSARDGGSKWHWRTWDEPRPLYLPLGTHPGQRSVVLVEGEVKGELLQQLLEAEMPGVYAVASWPGGCKAWSKADWAWLAGCTVLLWPDCDAKRERLTVAERKSVLGDDEARRALEATKPLLPEHKQPGMAAMLGIGAHLRDAFDCTVSLLPIPKPLAVADGWDAGDAIKTDGWDGARVLAFFGQAQALPNVPVAELGAALGAKKIEGLVGTAGGGDGGGKPPAPGAMAPDDEEGHVWVGGHQVPGWMSYYYDAEKARWNVSRKMVIACLRRLPDLAGVLGFDELRNSTRCLKAWPWPHAQAGEPRSADGLLMGDWLSETYGLPSISKQALEEGFVTVANQNRFHPIREYLGGLQWDGKARLDKWLIHVLGENRETLRPALFEYLTLVGRYWVLGMVNRVMEPGCKFDYCPVLEGAGGLRKSTLVETLAGSEYFSDSPFEVGKGKEAQEQVQGIWLYEIAELSHFSKSEVGAIKGFISSKADRYRVAYGTTVETFQRQCVLVGTTNEDTYLRDRTGNRRFWPTPVRNVINTEWVERNRGQLLAEAYARYLQGERFTPDEEEERRLFKPMQDSRLIETAVESDLLHVLTRNPQQAGIGAMVNGLTEFVTMAQLCQALGVDAAKAPPGLQGQVSGWLKHEGWEHVKRQVEGHRAWGYARPKNWPNDDKPEGLDAPAPQPAPTAAAPAGAPAPEPVGVDGHAWNEEEPF